MNIHKVTVPFFACLFFACIATGALSQETVESRKSLAATEQLETPDHEIAAWMINEYNKQIVIAKLGKQKATDEVVRQFADKIAKDHQLAKEKFSKWANGNASMDLSLVVSRNSGDSDVSVWVADIRDLDRETLSNITRSLIQSTGKDFDRNFMDAQVRFHQGLKAADRILANLASPACRSKIEECLEKDVEHLKESNQIIKWLGNASELQTARK